MPATFATRKGLALLPALLALLAVAAPRARAQAPFLGGRVNFTAALLPWPTDNKTQSFAASDPFTGTSSAKLTLGPCVYRQVHIHFGAVETFLSIKGSIQSVQIHPNNTVFTTTVTPGNAVTYPIGWLHYQYNPTCGTVEGFASFSALNAGTVNIANNLAALPDDYLMSAFESEPESKGLWAWNEACWERCYKTRRNNGTNHGANNSSANGGYGRHRMAL